MKLIDVVGNTGIHIGKMANYKQTSHPIQNKRKDRESYETAVERFELFSSIEGYPASEIKMMTEKIELYERLGFHLL